MKQVYRNIEKCCITFYRLGNQCIFRICELNSFQQLDEINILDEIHDSGLTKNEILDGIFVVSLLILVKMFNNVFHLNNAITDRLT